MKKLLFATPVTEIMPSIGLLIGRLFFAGFMLVGHGWGKMMKFGDLSEVFPDPLGMGSTASLISAVAAEVVFAGLLLIGLGTRVVVIPLVFTMFVAGVIIHADGPLFLPGQAAKEPALLYLAAFSIFCFTGAGRFSVDYVMGKKSKTKAG